MRVMTGASLIAIPRRESGLGRRWTKPVATGLSIAVLGIAVLELVANLSHVLPPGDSFLGMDFFFYRDIAARWVETGAYYLPHQLTGPYPATLMVVNLYPPPALLLFVPFLVLPAILWWVIPIGVLAWFIAWCRPAPIAWPLLALVLIWPRTQTAFLFGNTDLWMAAAIAGGLRRGWPAALLVLKPTFLIFAVVGIRRREFWLAIGVLALVSIPMAALWVDYVQAMRNVTIDADYSLGSLPLIVAPLIAWLLRARPNASATPTGVRLFTS
jgi:hypothetical protein